MKRFGHGFAIGKFRPPHKGHSLLIRTALEQCQRVTLVVCADASDTIPAELRAVDVVGPAEQRLATATGAIDAHLAAAA